MPVNKLNEGHIIIVEYACISIVLYTRCLLFCTDCVSHSVLVHAWQVADGSEGMELYHGTSHTHHSWIFSPGTPWREAVTNPVSNISRYNKCTFDDWNTLQ